MRTSEEHYRSIVDNIPGLVFTTTAEGELDWVNRALLAYFGRSIAELREWQMLGVIHPEDLPGSIARWNEGVASGNPYELEQRLCRHDGAYRWFHFRAAPLRDERGRIVRWYGLVTDIDELKRAREAACLGAQRLRLILDNIPGFIYTLTPAGELEHVNRRVLDFYQLSLDELRDWRRVMHPDDLEPVRARVMHSVATGTPWETEVRMRRADGVYRWFQCKGFPLRDSDGRILRWYGIDIDIDDLKRAEDALRGIQGRLSRASRLAAVSELAASIAHEINQPLAAVVSGGQALHRWLSTEPPDIERALLSIEGTLRDGNAAAQSVARIRSLFGHAAPAQGFDAHE